MEIPVSVTKGTHGGPQIRITPGIALRLRNEYGFSLWKAISEHLAKQAKEVYSKVKLDNIPELGEGFLTYHRAPYGEWWFEIFSSSFHRVILVRMQGEPLNDKVWSPDSSRPKKGRLSFSFNSPRYYCVFHQPRVRVVEYLK